MCFIFITPAAQNKGNGNTEVSLTRTNRSLLLEQFLMSLAVTLTLPVYIIRVIFITTGYLSIIYPINLT